MRKFAAIWLIMAAMITSGCQTLGSLEAPEVSVTGIALNSISLFEQEWGLTLRARNPNDRELTLKSLDYEIFINGEKFARGLTGESVTLRSLPCGLRARLALAPRSHFSAPSSPLWAMTEAIKATL